MRRLELLAARGAESVILEEMVFERLRAAVNPDLVAQLLGELDRSTARATALFDDEPEDPAEVKLQLLRRALGRLGECTLASPAVSPQTVETTRVDRAPTTDPSTLRSWLRLPTN